MTKCIEHTQQGNKAGYGIKHYKGRNHTLHRVVYMQHNNVEPDELYGEVILHTCDNPRCINPEHLVRGTQWANLKDMDTKGRGKFRGEDHGQCKLTDDEVRYIRDNYTARSVENSGVALAAKFGVNKATISEIVHGKKRKQLLEDIHESTVTACHCCDLD